MSAALIAKLIEAGTPAELVAEVAMELGRADAERAILAERRKNERERKARSRDITGQHVTERDSADTPENTPPFPSPLPSPQTPKQTPHPHTPPRDTRTREARFPVPDGVTAEQWRGFVQQRKKPLTQRAYDLLTGKLVEFSRDGWPPGDLIDLATERGWETIFKPKEPRNDNQRRSFEKPCGWTAGRTRSGG